VRRGELMTHQMSMVDLSSGQAEALSYMRDLMILMVVYKGKDSFSDASIMEILN
jgi:hypothetical protein